MSKTMANPVGKHAAEATQAEVYALLAAYGGYLDARQRSQIDHLLAEMSYPEQPVGDARGDVGDALYFAACRAVDALLACEADGAGLNPPPVDVPPRGRANRAWDAVVERSKAGKAWRNIVREAFEKEEAETK